jgi:small subunit ribosomal protein S4
LFLKGERCYSSACAIERRSQPPGMTRTRRGRKPSIYGQRLREKQKAKRIYRLRERQFRNYVEAAKRVRGAVTGDELMMLLERRLDNIVYRAGLAASREQARQLVGHGHFAVNGRSMNLPSYQVKPGDEVSFKPGAQKKSGVKALLEAKGKQSVPAWLERFEGGVRLLELPKVDALEHSIQTNLIVEYYSR